MDTESVSPKQQQIVRMEVTGATGATQRLTERVEHKTAKENNRQPTFCSELWETFCVGVALKTPPTHGGTSTRATPD